MGRPCRNARSSATERMEGGGSALRGARYQVLCGDFAECRFDGVPVVADREDEFQPVPGPAAEGGAERGALAVVPCEFESKTLESAIREASRGGLRPHLALAVPHVLQSAGQAFGVPEHGFRLVCILAVG